MRLLLIAITGTLIFWPLPTQSQAQDLNNVHYDLIQSGNHYTIRGTFFVRSNPNCLLHIFYDFEHLSHIVTEADSLILLREGEDWYDVAYIYHCLFLKGRVVYRKTLIQEKMKVSFEMIDSDQRRSLLPKVVSSGGYYEIKPEKDGYRVIYWQEGLVADAWSTNIFFPLLEKETKKFLHGLKDYVERTCY
jgi:hypothetical protein